MISVLIDAALRSLIVGLIVAVGLRMFRVRNVVARKAVLALLLAGAVAMPLLRPIADRLQLLPVNAGILLPAHPMTALGRLSAQFRARSDAEAIAAPLSMTSVAEADRDSGPAPKSAPVHRSKERELFSIRTTPAGPVTGRVATGGQVPSLVQSQPRAFSAVFLAFSIYLVVAAVLLLRLGVGLAVTLRLWFTAAPISAEERSDIAAGIPLRASSKVGSPLTIGSAILLPADFETWDKEKFRIVLAHERSHIRQGDFYLQLVAGLYAALVWFSPLGWWLKRELADLAEAISDRAGIEEARSRTGYAQILLEFAAAPRRTALGVAMARSGSISRRIERLLNDHTFRQSFAGGQRARLAVALVPVALFAATAMVQVKAATNSPHVAWIAPVSSPAAAVPSESSTPAVSGREAPSEPFVVQGSDFDSVSAVSVPDGSPSAPEAETPGIASPAVAATEETPSALAVPTFARAVVAQSESGHFTPFDRTLSASATAQLFVSTGSGDIHLTRGSGNEVHIHGKIHVSREGSEEQASQIAANPPLEQNGDTIRVGQQHGEHWHGISIDYQIEAPAGITLAATSGSGDVVDEGVGKNAKLETGSGDIRANGLEGPFEVKTGSGNITAEQTGQGEVKAETGSGDIEIKDIHGGFYGRTGSGNIKANGTPSEPWTLETGSGNVEISPGNAPLTLDASTGSGSVTTEHEMLVKGSLDHHHVTGNLNGGGPLVRVHTGSGDVHVH